MVNPILRRLSPLLLVLLVACAQQDRDSSAAGIVQRGIVFTPDNWPQSLAADLWLPASGTAHPVVMLVHGGGWARRSREDMDSVAEALQAEGFAVFNISYRFAPRWQFPAQVHDLQSGVNWIADNAAEYGLDTSRVSVWGYSSGAHLAALLASAVPGNRLFKPYGNVDIHLHALVAGGTPSDLRKFDGSNLVMDFLGGGREEIPARYETASPISHVSSAHPPTFLYHGGLDWIVSRDHAEDYAQALEAADVSVTLAMYPAHGHSSLFIIGTDARQKAIEFLHQRNAAQQ